MRILITGGAGYIGYSLVHNLLDQPAGLTEIVIYDNLSRANYGFFSSEKMEGVPIRFVRGELLDGRNLEKQLRNIDVVYHLAAKVFTPFADRDAHFFDQINHWGTAQLVAAVEKSPSVKQFIYLSSISVYGHTDTPVDEDYAPHPTSFYGISKLDGEEHVRRLKSKIKVQIIRSGNVYGFNPCMRIDAVINKFMFAANFRGQITINGGGTQMRSFIGLEKIANLLGDLVRREVPEGIFNAVEYNFAINDIVEHLQELYPDLEMLFINQNMKMREISIQTPCKVFEYVPLQKKGFLEELREFKGRFSF